MLNEESLWVMLGVCGAVLLIGYAKKWARWGITGIVRAVSGAFEIYALNLLLNALGVSLSVGINLFNLLVVGIFGLPGLGLLYAVLAVPFF